MSAAPSSREYWVWQCNGAKSHIGTGFKALKLADTTQNYNRKDRDDIFPVILFFNSVLY
jgi:hypothetical protein